MTTEVAALLQAGKLSQECPYCGRTEAAGSYCTGCARPMAETDWRRLVLSEAQRRARRVNGCLLRRAATKQKRASSNTKSPPGAFQAALGAF